jgi:hypothetical protein
MFSCFSFDPRIFPGEGLGFVVLRKVRKGRGQMGGIGKGMGRNGMKR